MLRVRGLTLGLLVVAGGLTLARGGNAQTRFEFGARTGYGVPFGKGAEKGTLDIKDLMVGQIPLWLDVGARIQQHVFVGAYFSYGFGIFGHELSKECDAVKAQAAGSNVDVACRAYDARVGAEAFYHLAAPNTSIDPWFGGGFGYEWLGYGYGLSQGSASADLTFELRGFELVNFQAGVDFPLSPTTAIGPFVGLTLAEYKSVSGNCSGDCSGLTTSSVDINGRTVHEWLLLGVRATFPL